jgi:hypothetical protein
MEVSIYTCRELYRDLTGQRSHLKGSLQIGADRVIPKMLTINSRPSRNTDCSKPTFPLVHCCLRTLLVRFEHPFRIDADYIMQMTMPFESWYIRNTEEPKQRHEAPGICVTHGISTSRDLGFGSITPIAKRSCLFRVLFPRIGKFISNLQEYLHGVIISLFAAFRFLSCD